MVKRKSYKLYPRFKKRQKIQSIIINWLRKHGYDAEGRMYIYLNDRFQQQQRIYGYTVGLPQIEIHNSKGKYTKCAIYLKPELDKYDNKIKETLKEECGYLVLFYNITNVAAIKKSITQQYLNIKKKKRVGGMKRKREKSSENEVEEPRAKKRRKINNSDQPYSEKEFHISVVNTIRNMAKHKNIILEGRIQGNLPTKSLNGFSNRMGYMKDSPDITIKNKSKFGFDHLDIELKIKNSMPRDTQRDWLLNFEYKHNHFPCYINTREGKEQALKELENIIGLYFDGPLDKLLQNKLK